MPTSAHEPLLEVSGLSAGYGKIGVLHGIDTATQSANAFADFHQTFHIAFTEPGELPFTVFHSSVRKQRCPRCFIS